MSAQRLINQNLRLNIMENGEHVLRELRQEIVEDGLVSPEYAKEMKLNGKLHVTATHVWYEIESGDTLFYGMIEGNGFPVAVLDTKEFDDYEA